MPVDAREIEKAMDSFVEDDFVAAKELVAAQIKGARDTFLKDKLSLKDQEPEVEDDASSGDEE